MSRGLFRASCACLVAVAALGTAACVPQDKGSAKEVGDARSADPVPTPPKFPDTGPVPASTMADKNRCYAIYWSQVGE